jgi:hypothetical protein
VRAVLLLWVLSLSACRCEQLRPRAAADFRVAPNPLVLPSGFVGQRLGGELTVDNLGGVTETVSLSIDAPFSVSVAELTLGSGASERLTVEVTPEHPGITSATLLLGPRSIPVSVEARAVPSCPPTACTTSAFDFERGDCVTVPTADGVRCDDGCVTGTCRAGVCEGTFTACDDRDACTTDACGANGCLHVPLRCPSAGPCSAPACDATTGCTSVEAPDGTLCGADDCRASEVDVCIAGQCVTRPRPDTGRCVNTWVPGTLSYRSGHALAWDATRSRVVLFGGYTSWSQTPETWEWNGTAWEVRTPAQSPPSSYRPAMAFDVSRSRTVLVTPKTDRTSELWEWDGITWVLRVGAASAPATHGDPNSGSVGVAYDSVRRVTVIVVFRRGLSEPIETWEWNGTALRPRAPTRVPRVNNGAGTLAWDGTLQRVVLVGSNHDPTFTTNTNVMWDWDGTTWTDRSSSAAGIDPWGTFLVPPAWDADRRWLVLKSTGVTLTFDGTTWRSMAATGVEPRGSQSPMVFDTARRQFVLFDGTLTWTWTGTSWTTLTQNASPRLVAVVTDTVRQRVLGIDLDQPPTMALWEWNRRGWTPVAASNAPTARPLSLAFDSRRDRLVLVGGGETWEFDGMAWARRSSVHQPSSREAHSLAYDPIRQRVLLYGGRASSVGPTLGDVWEWDGMDWVELSNPSAPSARSHAPMSWDSTNTRLLMLAPAQAMPTIEAWSWTGTWANVTPPTPLAAPRFIRTMAEDPVRRTIVGIESVSFNTMATWEFGPSGWTRRLPTVSLGTSAFPLQGAAWDPRERQVVLSGVGQTWLFLP